MATKKITKICHFWFNTGFVKNNHVLLEKPTIDVANKDKKCKVFKEDFTIEGFFGPWTEDKKTAENGADHYEDLSLEEEKPEGSEEEDGVRKRTKSFYDYSEYNELPLDLEDETDGTDGETEEEKSDKMETKQDKPEKEYKLPEKPEKSEKELKTEKVEKVEKPRKKDKKEEKVPKKAYANGSVVKLDKSTPSKEEEELKRKSKQSKKEKEKKKK